MEGNPTPPPQYAAYPRAGEAIMYGTSEKLRRLYRGYKGTTFIVLLGILSYLLIIPSGIAMQQPGNETVGTMLYILPIAGAIWMWVISVRTGMDVAYGSDWPIAVGVILGLFTPCFGIVVIAIVGFVASSEIKRYGLKTRFFRGYDKAEVSATIERLRQYEQGVANQTQPVQSANFRV